MKQKVTILLLALVLCLLPTACSQAPSLPGDYPMELVFSSGAGAWRTVLVLNADGTFTGQYSDSDMGDADPTYPNGTLYLCGFSGRFDVLSATAPNAIPLRLTELTCEVEPGHEEIKDGIRHIYAGPHGFYGYESDTPAEQFILYTPGTSTAELSEELLSWWPGRFEETVPSTLGCYALCSPDAGTAFFSYTTFS